MWTYPRTVSTAFERAFKCRPNTKTFHEPFGNAYYFGPERVVDQAGDGDRLATFKSVTDQLLVPLVCKENIVFAKDMAYYIHARINQLPLQQFCNTFLIRHPAKSIHSYLKTAKNIENYQIRTEEFGVKQLYDLFKYVTETLQQKAVVIDADDLVENPYNILKKYCDACEIEFFPLMLTWNPKSSDADFKIWDGWHNDALQSNGFVKKSYTKEELFPEAQSLIEENLSFYQHLYQYRLH